MLSSETIKKVFLEDLQVAYKDSAPSFNAWSVYEACHQEASQKVTYKLRIKILHPVLTLGLFMGHVISEPVKKFLKT